MPLVGAAALVAATAVVAAPAQAATCAQATTCPTTVTFSITAGELEITVPDAVDIGSGASGTVISGQLGPVTVEDGRATLGATWEATVIAATGGWTTGTGTPAETVPNTAVDYWSGTATTDGDGTFTAGQPTAGDAVPIDTEQTAYSKDDGDGPNSATWNPTLVVNVPATAVAGVYAGTVNHSVA
ncbi:hypothetical protein [Actinopolymorpha pittospori]